MYAACGAVSKADHEKIQADLETAEEATKETKEDLKKETKSRKDAEKKVEQSESDIEALKAEKEKLDTESKKAVKDAAAKAADLTKAQKEVAKLKADLEKEVEKATEAQNELQAAKDRAETAEAELEKKIEEAAQLKAEEEKIKEEANEKIAEVQAEEANLEDDVKKKEKDMTRKIGVFSTGLCSCCAKPGGVGHCFKGFCCPCLLTGRMNASLKNSEEGKAPCPGGCPGGCCLGCCCLPCYMCKAAPAIATMKEKEIGKCKACMCGMCCPCCFLTQTHREYLIIEAAKLEAPLQESMGEGGEGAAAKEKPEKGTGMWSTGLCKCCAKPGGCKLCCQACFCPCMITMKTNIFLKDNDQPACCLGKCGGCCFGCCCLPCFMRKAGPGVSTQIEKDPPESKCKACMKGCCCPTCYLCQVYREILTIAEAQ